MLVPLKLMLPSEMGFTNILLEGDALIIVINKVIRTSSSLSGISNLIKDVKKLMKQFRCYKVQHVRTANEATHLLAKSALMIDEKLY